MNTVLLVPPVCKKRRPTQSRTHIHTTRLNSTQKSSAATAAASWIVGRCYLDRRATLSGSGFDDRATLDISCADTAHTELAKLIGSLARRNHTNISLVPGPPGL